MANHWLSRWFTGIRSQDYIQKHIKQCKANTVPQAIVKTRLNSCTATRLPVGTNEGCMPTIGMTLDLLKAHDEGYLNYQRDKGKSTVVQHRPFWGSFYGNRLLVGVV